MIVVIYALLFGIAASSPILSNTTVPWEHWKVTHGKTYTSLGEEIKRNGIWQENMMKIRRHNEEFENGKHSFELAMNKFGDLTDDEFRKLYSTGVQRLDNMMGISDGPLADIHLLSNTTLPDSVDWRKKGLVASVKDQGQCGSCWAFSAVGAIEGQLAKKTGKLIGLSEQQLVDCSWAFGNEGCNGGLMTKACKYITKYGIESRQAYPYTGRDDSCKYSQANVVTAIKDYKLLSPHSEFALQNAVATVGPISVSLDASLYTFRFYHNGIYNDSQCTAYSYDARHAVLTVGYDKSYWGEDYWIVKNSWGVSWGDQGYIKIARNAGNRCGIANRASYPVF